GQATRRRESAASSSMSRVHPKSADGPGQARRSVDDRRWELERFQCHASQHFGWRMTANDPAQVAAECSIACLESLAFARREIPDMPIGAASILATRCKQPPAQRPTHPRPGLPFAMLLTMVVAEQHF